MGIDCFDLFEKYESTKKEYNKHTRGYDRDAIQHSLICILLLNFFMIGVYVHNPESSLIGFSVMTSFVFAIIGIYNSLKIKSINYNSTKRYMKLNLVSILLIIPIRVCLDILDFNNIIQIELATILVMVTVCFYLGYRLKYLLKYTDKREFKRVSENLSSLGLKIKNLSTSHTLDELRGWKIICKDKKYFESYDVLDDIIVKISRENHKQEEAKIKKELNKAQMKKVVQF